MGAFDEFVSKHGDEVRREIHIVEVEQTQSRALVESEAGHKGVGRNADGASEIVGEVLGVIAESGIVLSVMRAPFAAKRSATPSRS